MIPVARTRSEIETLPANTLVSELAAAMAMYKTLAKTTRRFHSEIAYLQKRIKREKRK